jgi:hypothetical protein
MLSLILAMAVVAAEPAPAPPPAATVTKVSKMDQVVCKWRTNGAGHRMEVCQTNRQWRDDQLESQKRFDDFQKRALHTQPR